MISLEAERYLTWLLRDRGFSRITVSGISLRLKAFIEFLSSRGIKKESEITRELIEDWIEGVSWRVNKCGQAIKVETRIHYLSNLRCFLHYLYKRDLTLTDLSSFVTLPKSPRRLPGEVLEPGEVVGMIEEAKGHSAKDMRDRVVFEVLYSSGLRASELSKLSLEEVDYDTGLIYVRCGKGGKDRVVPLGRYASKAVREYLLTGRPRLLLGPDPGTLLLNLRGRPMRTWSILEVVKAYAVKVGLKKRVTTHALRRTCATLMLRDGANIRAIQDMLGHEDIQTTALYLKVSAREIKEEHEKHHPREKAQCPETGAFVDKG